MSEIVSTSLKSTYLTLRIINENDLDIEDISRKLDLEPSSVMRRGQLLHQTRKRADWCSWHYSTEDLDSLNIKAHFAVLFKKLEGKSDVLTRTKSAALSPPRNRDAPLVGSTWLDPVA